MTNETFDYSSICEPLTVAARTAPEKLAFRELANGEAVAREIGYFALDQLARKAATRLRERTRPGDRVVLLARPGIDYIAAFFGALYAGLVAVPAYPPRRSEADARIRHLVADASPSALIVSPDVAPWLRSTHEHGLTGLHTIDLDSLADASAQPDVHASKREDLAFLQYTSGSTGQPRGVMLTHGSLLANVEAIRQRFAITGADSGMLWLPPYHDMGLIGGLIQSVYSQIPVTLMAPAHFIARPMRWLEAISRYRATISGAPSFAYDLAARRATDAEVEQLDLSSWSVAFNGAEPIRAEAIRRFNTRFAAAGFSPRAHYACYGLAEATLIVAAGARAHGMVEQTFSAEALSQRRVAAADASKPLDARSLVSVGQVVAGHTLRIVDPESRRELPAGQVGEIWFEGPSVARGYWNKPSEALFRAKLVDANGAEQGAYLRTGDLGFEWQGELFIAGREKDLLILFGRNHHPQDIEETTEKSHPAVRPGNVAAFSVERGGDEVLVIVAEADRSTPWAETAAAIRRNVSMLHQLPVEEVVIVRKASIPKTSSGKIRRSTTREQYSRAELHVEYRTSSEVAAGAGAQEFARTPEERVVADVWARALDLSEVPLRRTFAELGGSSLSAVEIATQLQRLGFEVDAEALFEHPTVEALAARLRPRSQRDSGLDTLLAEPIPVSGDQRKDLPLSPVQRRYWTDYMVDRGRSWANMYGRVAVPGELNEAALRFALGEILRRHESLRTTFPLDASGTPLQHVQEVDAVPVELTVHDLRSLPESERAAVLADIEHSVANQPFDLARAPLCRLSCVHGAPEGSLVLGCFHHLVADGFSLIRLRAEILGHYRRYLGGDRAPAPLPLLQFRDYAIWQERIAGAGGLDASKQYWHAEMADHPPYTCLPVDDAAARSADKRGAGCQVVLPSNLRDELERASVTLRCSLPVLVMTSLFEAVHRRTGADDIIIGTPLNGRDRPETHEIVGICINQVPIRLRHTAGATFAARAGQVRSKLLRALQHQQYQSDALVRDLGLPRDDHRLPVTNVFFTQLKYDHAMPGNTEPGKSVLRGHLTDVRFDMMWYLHEFSDKLVLECKFRRALFSEATVTEMVTEQVALLRTLLSSAA